MVDEITYPFPNGAAVEVWELKSNVISHFTGHVIHAGVKLRYGPPEMTTDLFLRSRSQYLASSSGDLLEELAIFVTALTLMKRPHALSKAATKPASLLKATSTKALYFLWTSSMVCT